ncbi:insulin gene enhancer protein ISL-1 [Eurytemora carolleeae]|uniref:insulin gene enhancer protein ISL-1 n=1 Tax=Eurytemora carolleeae TaxID=1294199 RepID=UPI000C76B7EF|nr:insulin gene enhancer protein ISL-1 [Eurytemora carolleeae]|eukprot:XP_023321181.1 insulin gene enhancer protein ISL-1-like [Eurytemora affinis]
MKMKRNPIESLPDNLRMSGIPESLKRGLDALPPLCVGCHSPIHDQFILRVSPDLSWHAACLKCNECQMFLDETCTCFVRDGKTYCKKDYVRLFGAKCDKCGCAFGKNDYVMRAKNRIFHLECFRCVACERQLIPGDSFALREDGLFCNQHHRVDKEDGSETNNNKTILNNNSNNSEDGDDKSEEGTIGDLSDGESLSGLDTEGLHDSKKHKRNLRKTARARTVLSEKQLNILKTCYSANPRPDALMKEQLVEMTGLSPRVIRVWFQNKRCKDKKIQNRLIEKQLQGEKDGRKLGYGNMQGIPMIASSPVRHESSPLMNPVDIHGYQPPWKALSEFAMQPDIERLDPGHPNFHHIMQQMHGYPGDLLPPGCRLPPPPGPLHGPHEILYRSPPDMVLHPPTDMDPSCSPDDWSQDPPPGTDLYPRPDTEPEFGYLDTSDDSGRHTGPDPSSP